MERGSYHCSKKEDTWELLRRQEIDHFIPRFTDTRRGLGPLGVCCVEFVLGGHRVQWAIFMAWHCRLWPCPPPWRISIGTMRGGGGMIPSFQGLAILM